MKNHKPLQKTFKNPICLRGHDKRRLGVYPGGNCIECKLEKDYGISYDKVLELKAQQNSKCAICGEPEASFKKSLHIDHNHATGTVRGLLCFRCNFGLSFIEDDLWCISARSYLGSVYTRTNNSSKKASLADGKTQIPPKA